MYSIRDKRTEYVHALERLSARSSVLIDSWDRDTELSESTREAWKEVQSKCAHVDMTKVNAMIKVDDLLKRIGKGRLTAATAINAVNLELEIKRILLAYEEKFKNEDKTLYSITKSSVLELEEVKKILQELFPLFGGIQNHHSKH